MDAASSVLAVRLNARPLAASPRDLYIDRLRSVMTAFVVLHHTAVTYGALGSWFHYDPLVRLPAVRRIV